MNIAERAVPLLRQDRAGVTISVDDAGMVLNLAVFDAAPGAVVELARQMKLPSMPPVGRVARSGEVIVVGFDSRSWLLIEPSHRDLLHYVVDAEVSVVRDWSAGYETVEVRGAAATELLCTGCSLELDRVQADLSSFPRTRLFGIDILLRGLPDGYSALVGRSYRDALVNRLRDATAGLGSSG